MAPFCEPEHPVFERNVTADTERVDGAGGAISPLWIADSFSAVALAADTTKVGRAVHLQGESGEKRPDIFGVIVALLLLEAFSSS